MRLKHKNNWTGSQNALKRSVEWTRLMAGVTESASSLLGIIVFEIVIQKTQVCLMVNNNNVLSDFSSVHQEPLSESYSNKLF